MSDTFEEMGLTTQPDSPGERKTVAQGTPDPAREWIKKNRSVLVSELNFLSQLCEDYAAYRLALAGPQNGKGSEVECLSELINAYRAKRKVDGGGAYPRPWSAAEHLKWDAEIERLELALNAPTGDAPHKEKP